MGPWLQVHGTMGLNLLTVWYRTGSRIPVWSYGLALCFLPGSSGWKSSAPTGIGPGSPACFRQQLKQKTLTWDLCLGLCHVGMNIRTAKYSRKKSWAELRQLRNHSHSDGHAKENPHRRLVPKENCNLWEVRHHKAVNRANIWGNGNNRTM